MLNLLLLILSILLIVACKRSPAIGCAYLLVLRMLIPPCARVSSISFNTLMLCIIVVFFVRSLYKNSLKISSTSLYPVNFLIIPLLILCVFAPTPFNFQFSQLSQFFITEILIFTLLMYFIQSEDHLSRIFQYLRYAYMIIGIYGILTYVIRQNPLFTYFAKYFNYTINFTGDGTIALMGGMAGRASGNLSGPLPWGQTSLAMLILFVFFETTKKEKMSYIVIFLACLNCFLSTKRSVIVPMFIILIYLLKKNMFFSKKKILKLLCIPFVLCLLWNIPFFDTYKQNIVSATFFWDDDVAYKNNIRGSSTELRQNQFEYALIMVKDHFLCGLGYGYPQYYSKHHGMHPIMLGFESLVYQVLVPSGIIGCFVWICFFYKSYRFTLHGIKKTDALICHGTYIFSCFLTGIQASFFWYMVIIALLYKKGTFRNASLDYHPSL